MADPGFGVRGIYVTLISALGAQPRFHIAELIGQTQTLLATETLERHRQVLLVVDEAQTLSAAQLHVLRVLTLCRARDYAESGLHSTRIKVRDGPRHSA